MWYNISEEMRMNYYEILEVSVNASQEVIKNAYRALIKKYHPDSYTGNKQYAEEMIKKINEAYETLSDENKRLLYDYDEGFKVNPNVSLDEIVEDDIIKKEVNVKDNKNYKEFKIEEFIKKHKVLVVISIIVIFILAFLIGNAIAGNQEKEQKQNVKQENKVENEKENTQNNKYSPNYEYKYNNQNKQENNNQPNVDNSNLNQNDEDKDNETNDNSQKEENKTDINSGMS